VVRKKKDAMKKLNIAIDGYSGCGKSTLAKDIAKALDLTFVDTGALYRGLTYFLLSKDIPLDEEAVRSALQTHIPHLRFRECDNHLLLNELSIEQDIRNRPDIASNVSKVAAMEIVRSYLMRVQQDFIDQGGVVMEGRDIGTVVMPMADVKLFITATTEERVERRFKQLMNQGVDITREEVEKNLIERDQQDATRAIAPLKKAPDAIAMDTTDYNQAEQLKACLALIQPYLHPENFFRFIQ